MNWYKLFKYNQSAEGVAQKTYYDIGHDKNQEDAMWVYNDGRVEVSYRKDCQVQSCFSHMDQFGGIILSLVYRGRYDGYTKKISLSKPVGMGQFRDVPSGLIYKLNQIFPENSGISTYEFASSFKEYKKAQQRDEVLEQYPKYTNIGHGDEENDWMSHDLDALWMSDLSGNNFHMRDPINYEHIGMADEVGLNMQTGTIQGRFDGDKNMVSLTYNPRIVTMKEIPNRLMNRLYMEFGDNITIIDYSHGSGKRLI